MDNSMNVSTAPRSSVLLQMLLRTDSSLELMNKIPLETAKGPRSSQSIRQSERSGGDAADVRLMSPDQAPELPQKTDFDGHRQESNQDGLQRQDLQVHPRVRSSPEAGLEAATQFRLALQICENGQDRVTAGQKIFPPLCQYGRQLVVSETPEEYQTRTEMSEQEDQKTGHNGYRQESSQDLLPRRDLQVHPRVRSSPQTGLEIAAEFLPEPQRQITSETDYLASETQRMIPETPEEYEVRTERCQQEDQETDRDGPRQESSQDVLPWRDLQVYPRVRSSPQTGLKITIESRPEIQRQITSETDYSASETQWVIPEAPEENQVSTERSHQADQKLYRMYCFSMPSGRKDLADDRPLKPLDMNVPRPMIRSSLTTPYHFQMPSQNYQLIVSRPDESHVTGNLSSVYPQDQRNRTDSIKQEVMSQGNLRQPESYCPTSAAGGKLENEQPTLKDSIPWIPRFSFAERQQYMEQYLDLWATEPNFLEDVARIASTILQIARQKSKKADCNSQLPSRPIIFNNKTSSQGET